MIRIFPLLVIVLLGGCAVGPNYRRPEVPLPPGHRAGAADLDAAASLADMKWFDLFQDEALRTLIRQALANNFDVRIAAQRVTQAEGQLTAVRSGFWPQLGVQGTGARQGVTSPVQSSIGIFGFASWEIDLFGRIRRSAEAARADLQFSREDQSAVLQSIVASVAEGYFTLRDYDAQLALTRASLQARRDSLRLVDARLQGGVGTRVDLDQAQSLVAAAASDVIALERAVEQTENLIAFLAGRFPSAPERGKPLVEQPQPAQVPAGLPAALLERRPDIRAAEQRLVAANARVGVAKAAFFPSIQLTGAAGYQSVDLLGIIQRSSAAYNVAGVADLPLFDAGRRVGNYRVAKAVREELVINYQRSINNALRDVADSLIGYRKAREFRAQQELLAATLRDQSRLSQLRYRGGVTSYLEVLDTERQRLQAEQQLSKAQRQELVAMVQLYRALGGGWQQ